MTPSEEDQELTLALLQCEGDYQRIEVYRLFGHHDKADELEHKYYLEQLEKYLWVSAQMKSAIAQVKQALNNKKP